MSDAYAIGGGAFLAQGFAALASVAPLSADVTRSVSM